MLIPFRQCFQVKCQSVAACFEKSWSWSYCCKHFVSALYIARGVWSLHSSLSFCWELLVICKLWDRLWTCSDELCFGHLWVFPPHFFPNSQGETKVLKLKNLRPQDYASYTCQVSVRNVCSIPDKSITFQLTNTTGKRGRRGSPQPSSLSPSKQPLPLQEGDTQRVAPVQGLQHLTSTYTAAGIANPSRSSFVARDALISCRSVCSRCLGQACHEIIKADYV